MFGISWGGFNSLQIAALAPEPLKAIVTVCSTDDRYDNDVHYMGGSVLAVDMHAWAATMLAFASRPPDPPYVGRGLARPVGETPRRPSNRSSTPGWHTRRATTTGGTAASARTTARSARPCSRSAAGTTRTGTPCCAWSSTCPADRVRGIDRALVAPVPGPRPAAGPRDRLPPGDPALVGPLAQGHRHRRHAGAAAPLLDQRLPPARHGVPDAAGPLGRRPGLALPVRGPGRRTPSRARPCSCGRPQHTGLDAGRFFPFGNDADLPPDQREEDAKSACFDFGCPEEI